MKKQEKNLAHESMMLITGKDRLSRTLLIVAIILYSTSLILLANLALAGEPIESKGALIKVNNQLNGESFASLNVKVKSVTGNILAINTQASEFGQLQHVKGICSSVIDHQINGLSSLDTKMFISKFSGADVVVGILDNSGNLGTAGIAALKKVEPNSNVGFISYRSGDLSSCVIIRNLKGGESNMVQALAYMQEYAKTVNKPLVIEMILQGTELNNPLFVQVCQKLAEAGIQFLGCPELLSATGSLQKASVQLAFSMFNSKTGQITDRSDFWAIDEIKDQDIMLLGSDDRTCQIHFAKESGFEKVFMSNSSEDIVVLTALTSSGTVSYHHIVNKEVALIPRELLNGIPVMEDGLAGIYPYHCKQVIFNDAGPKNQFVTLKDQTRSVPLGTGGKTVLSVSSPLPRTLSMSLNNLTDAVRIEIRDRSGVSVYKNRPDAETQRIDTRIHLSDGAEGLYYLDLSSASFNQNFAIVVN